MEELHYTSPKEAFEKEEFPLHTFELIVDGKKIGSASAMYFSKPLPMYQITNLAIDDPELQGKGFGGKIMSGIEEWLQDKKKPGILVDAIHADSPAKGMYTRRGWEYVKELEQSADIYVYNWPNDVDKSILRGFKQRYTDPKLRGSSGKWLAEFFTRAIDESTDE